VHKVDINRRLSAHAAHKSSPPTRGGEFRKTFGVWRRVTLNDLQISQVCRLVGYKAIMAAHVIIGGSILKKSTTACEEVGRNGVSV